jgi:hypothetical protein
VTGWTWDEALDSLTVPRFLALREELKRHPPAHWLLAAVLRRRDPDEERVTRNPSVAELEVALR